MPGYSALAHVAEEGVIKRAEASPLAPHTVDIEVPLQTDAGRGCRILFMPNLSLPCAFAYTLPAQTHANTSADSNMSISYIINYIYFPVFPLSSLCYVAPVQATLASLIP